MNQAIALEEFPPYVNKITLDIKLLVQKCAKNIIFAVYDSSLQPYKPTQKPNVRVTIARA